MPAQGHPRIVTLWRLAAIASAGAALALIPDTAAAAGCLDKVESLAQRHDLSTDPPTVTPDGKKEVTPRDLARSGGVIEPPPVRDKSVIEPPKTGSAMPTVPDVAPKQDKQASDTAKQTKLQAALMAARSQAERGNEDGCQEALARAETILKQEN
ncbi:MAG TPA: hypothetical protein VEC60_15405 [Reyranella sp.]|nr:hypothetical protein [Reyranella sp.]